MSKRRVSNLTTLDFARLNAACMVISEMLGDHPYLVGSATERHDFRDVDVRSILADEKFDELFPTSGLWSLFCLGMSSYLTTQSGLPVDYQVQRRTQANENFPGFAFESRNPIGTRGRLFAGGGDATGFGPKKERDETE